MTLNAPSGRSLLFLTLSKRPQRLSTICLTEALPYISQGPELRFPPQRRNQAQCFEAFGQSDRGLWSKRYHPVPVSGSYGVSGESWSLLTGGLKRRSIETSACIAGIKPFGKEELELALVRLVFLEGHETSAT